MAAPRMKPPVKKKKPPVKKPKVGTVKSPEETRKSISRKQVGTPRPAKDLNKGGLRAKFLQDAAKSAASRTIGTVLRTGLRVAGPVGALASMTVPAGTGSTVPGQAQKAVEKKMKREIRQGPKLAVTGVKEGTTRRLAPTGSRKPAPGSNYSGQDKASAGSPFSKGKGTASLPKVSGDALRRAGAGTYTASYDVRSTKTGPANTAATAAAAAGSNGGSKAAKAGGSVTNVSKAKAGKQTRYQRNETAMEQKRSSSRPKKSIFSLFRKG